MARKPQQTLADLAGLARQLEADRRELERLERLRKADEARRHAEAQLFRTVMADVVPLPPKASATIERPLPAPIAHQHLADEARALEQSLSDEFDVDTLLETDDQLGFKRETLGPDVLAKLRRGHWVVQDQIDLHGARTEGAREMVSDFLRDSTKRGLRCIRIIHGKGLGSPGKQPVLKDKVKRWLVQREEVIAFCQARAVDGGAGALLVLLKAWNA
ncbi:Smr/MutS family protein [soil metagenome]